MSTQKLPEHIGGFQHLEPDVICAEGDIYVENGKPRDFVLGFIGERVGSAEEVTMCRVYRRMACPRQGGDRALTADEQANLDKLKKIFTPDHQMSEPDVQPFIISPTYNGPARSEPVPTFHKIGSTGMPLPTDAKARKGIPIYSGFLKYFPRAVAAIAELSRIGNDQHNPGKPLHWDRSKSGDEHDALMRHLMQAGTVDSDGVRHSTKAAWRACAALEKELEAEEASK